MMEKRFDGTMARALRRPDVNAFSVVSATRIEQPKASMPLQRDASNSEFAFRTEFDVAREMAAHAPANGAHQMVWHGSAAKAQRGANVQPGGSACGNGTVPGIVVSCALTPSGALAISAAV